MKPDFKLMQDRFDASQKLAAIVDSNPAILGIMTRMGVTFPIGEATVAEACGRSGVHTATFLLICNIYTTEGFVPSAADLNTADPVAVLGYLRSSHAHYLGHALGALSSAIEKMMAPCDEAHRAVIRKFYGDYKAELEKHFRFEEAKVFPIMERLTDEKQDKPLAFKRIEDNHGKIDEKIEDLKNIVLKYLPKECDDELVARVLLYIYHLKYDLERHTAVEDLLLVPMIKAGR